MLKYTDVSYTMEPSIGHHLQYTNHLPLLLIAMPILYTCEEEKPLNNGQNTRPLFRGSTVCRTGQPSWHSYRQVCLEC